MTDFIEPLLATFGWMPPGLKALLVFGAVVAAGLFLQDVVVRVVTARSRDWNPTLRFIFQRTRRVLRFAIVVLAVAIVLPLVPLNNDQQAVGRHVLTACFIILVGWIVLAASNTAIDRYMAGLRIDVSDNLLARKAVTQMRVLRHALNILICLLTVGAALMSFDTVRQFGVSLFASAGVAGLAVGLAARPLLSNLIAGVQLALAQPIRVDDVVVIEGEWGRVEEFTSTYVVIKIWDWRRLIVPLSYFLEKPFTNWTRVEANIIGSVYLYTDYTVPVDKVRKKAEEIARESDNWDKNVIGLQVTDAKEHTLELRVLVSSVDSSVGWNMRCEMREKLIDYLQSEFPGSLPRLRGTLAADSRGGGAGARP